LPNRTGWTPKGLRKVTKRFALGQKSERGKRYARRLQRGGAALAKTLRRVSWGGGGNQLGKREKMGQESRAKRPREKTSRGKVSYAGDYLVIKRL